MGKKKQTLLAGGLISTFGIFISKMMGLMYVIPYYKWLGPDINVSYYGQSYNIYSYLLNVATAGLPFAIATLVARYVARGDFKTTLLIKKVSFYLMAAFGLVGMIVMMVLSGPMARSLVSSFEGDAKIMQISIMLISVAVFIVPILSSQRGYFQGLKQMKMYSTSQVLEQFVRIMFLLTFTFIAVNIVGMDPSWGVYIGVSAAAVSAAVTIVYIKNYERRHLAGIAAEIPQTTVSNITPKEILKELVILAIPFFLNALFGLSDTMINQSFLGPGLEAYGMSPTEIQAYTVAATAQVTKIIAIPMILAPGFIASVIPFMTESIEKNDTKAVKKSILQCIETVLYIALPICLAIFVFAKPIILIVFPINDANIMNLDIYVETMKWFSIEALMSTIVPLLSSLVMTIGGRKEVVRYTMYFAITKFATCYLFLRLFGIGGLILSSLLAFAILATLNIMYIQKKYQLNWVYTLRKIAFMLIGAIVFMLVGYVFSKLGWIDTVGSKLMTLAKLAIMGVASVGAYLAVTYMMQLPQVIFGVNLKSIKNRIKK